MKNYSVDVWDVIDNVWRKIAFADGIKMSFQSASHKFVMLSQKHPAGNVRLMNGDVCVMHNR